MFNRDERLPPPYETLLGQFFMYCYIRGLLRCCRYTLHVHSQVGGEEEWFMGVHHTPRRTCLHIQTNESGTICGIYGWY